MGADLCSAFVSEDNSEIEERCEYPEHEIVDLCETNVEAQTIRIAAPTRFTDMEVFTAMNKALLQHLFPEVSGKWLLTRAQIREYSESMIYRDVTIALKRNLDFRLTRSDILADGIPVGSIYFSLLRKENQQ
jgi:hypothetical protein